MIWEFNCLKIKLLKNRRDKRITNSLILYKILVDAVGVKRGNPNGLVLWKQLFSHQFQVLLFLYILPYEKHEPSSHLSEKKSTRRVVYSGLGNRPLVIFLNTF